MKTAPLAATLLAALLNCAAADRAPEPAKSRYYVQLVRGSDDPTPPPDSKRVGPKITKQLEPVFRWKHYWEVQRATITIEEGRTAKSALKSGHAIEVDLGQPGKRVIRLFRGKKLTRTIVCPRDKEFSIQGLDPGDGTVWFIVVRSDPPVT